MKFTYLVRFSTLLLLCLAPHVTWGQGASDALFDSPDEGEESRLHEIFSTYNAEPMPEDQWDVIARDFKGEDYVIQGGDNLWAISKVLFGDGFYWPKVWALNDKIENPHEIEPGHALRFFEGNFDAAPSVSVVTVAQPETAPQAEVEEGETEVTELQQKSAETNLKIFDPTNVVLPPPTAVSRPLMRNIPASLPNMEELARQKVEKMGRDLGVQRIKDWPADTYVSSFILDEEPGSVGRVIETELNNKSASLNQVVYVQVDDKRNFSKGTILSTFRAADNLFDRPRSKYSSFLYGGELEVLSQLKGNSDVYRCIVRIAVNPIFIGDGLLVGPIQRGNFYIGGDKGRIDSKIRAHIFGGEYDETRRVFAAQSIVYIDKGQAAGLRENQLYDIISNPEPEGLNKLVHEYRRKIGIIKIVKVSKDVATGIVLDAREPIRPGDFLGNYTGDSTPQSTQGKLIDAELMAELDQGATQLVLNQGGVDVKSSSDGFRTVP